MIRYRPFLNVDPPAIADIWRSQPPLRGLCSYITPSLLEQSVFAKSYFDRKGLILAIDGSRPIGFCHVGMAGSADGSGISSDVGVLSMLMVVPSADEEHIFAELLSAGEDYLGKCGAKKVVAGSLFPHNPFYAGLYGGAQLPGVLASNSVLLRRLLQLGYVETGRLQLLKRELSGFRPPLDMQQMQIKPQHMVVEAESAQPSTWWGHQVWANTEWHSYELQRKATEEVLASATFWDLEPLATSWGVSARGLLNISDSQAMRTNGQTTFLLAESLLTMHQQGIGLVEALASTTDAPLLAIFKKLGFIPYDEGVLVEKALG